MERYCEKFKNISVDIHGDVKLAVKNIRSKELEMSNKVVRTANVLVIAIVITSMPLK